LGLRFIFLGLRFIFLGLRFIFMLVYIFCLLDFRFLVIAPPNILFHHDLGDCVVGIVCFGVFGLFSNIFFGPFFFGGYYKFGIRMRRDVVAVLLC
jgi:hypothetical protein